MAVATEAQLALKTLSAQLEQLQEDNVVLRKNVDDALRLLQTKADSAAVDAQLTDIKASIESGISANQNTEREHGVTLAATYLVLHQVAYTLAALPVVTFYSMGSLYLKTQLQVPVATIGYCLTAGDMLGIGVSKYAELASDGFIFRRPHDIHILMLLQGAALLAVPLWPQPLWYGASASMMIVQGCDSALKPVINEAIYRLAVVTKSDPSIKFAAASKWRRAGACVTCLLAPLAFIAHPAVCFYASAPVMAVMTFAMARCAGKIDAAADLSERFGRIMRASYRMSPKKFRLFARVPGFSGKEQASKVSAVGLIENMAKDTAAEQSRTWSSSVAQVAKRVTSAGMSEEEIQRHGPGLKFHLLVLAIVHLFPFLDAFIIYMPFAFLTIAVKEQTGSVALAGMLVFCFQVTRGISQGVQSYSTSNAVDFWLTAASVVSYAVLLASLILDPGNSWWFYMVVTTGFSETLPVHQDYLIRLFSAVSAEPEEIQHRIREVIKVSYTLQNIGSSAAFFSGSAVYAAFEQRGIGILGLAAAGAKLAIVVAIGSSLKRAPTKSDPKLDYDVSAAEATSPTASAELCSQAKPTAVSEAQEDGILTVAEPVKPIAADEEKLSRMSTATEEEFISI